jgi:translation initiation factor 6
VIRLAAYYRNPNIGVFGRANDRLGLLPKLCPPDLREALEAALGIEVFQTNVCGTSLLGPLLAFNNHGLLVSHHAFEEEIRYLRGLDLKVGVLADRLTAFGNLVLLNDRGAVVPSGLARRTLREMEETLDCEVVPCEIQEFRVPGALGVATNKGAILHPLMEEEEICRIEEVLRVKADIGTVNRGVGLLRTGIIANSRGVLLGNESTGPEINRIQDSLGLL